MDKIMSISVEECCVHYSIETTFVLQLDEHGLIELDRSGQQVHIAYEQLPDLEKYMQLHYELNINMEGLEAIKHLLCRMQHLQQEVRRLENELNKGIGDF
jgi:hypothetical protein